MRWVRDRSDWGLSGVLTLRGNALFFGCWDLGRIMIGMLFKVSVDGTIRTALKRLSRMLNEDTFSQLGAEGPFLHSRGMDWSVFLFVDINLSSPSLSQAV